MRSSPSDFATRGGFRSIDLRTRCTSLMLDKARERKLTSSPKEATTVGGFSRGLPAQIMIRIFVRLRVSSNPSPNTDTQAGVARLPEDMYIAEPATLCPMEHTCMVTTALAKYFFYKTARR